MLPGYRSTLCWPEFKAKREVGCLTERCWAFAKLAVHSASLISCGTTSANHQILMNYLWLMNLCGSIPAGLAVKQSRPHPNCDLMASLRKDRESWWSKRDSEMRWAATSGNLQKLSHLIHSADWKRHGAYETIRKATLRLLVVFIDA